MTPEITVPIVLFAYARPDLLRPQCGQRRIGVAVGPWLLATCSKNCGVCEDNTAVKPRTLCEVEEA